MVQKYKDFYNNNYNTILDNNINNVYEFSPKNKILYLK